LLVNYRVVNFHFYPDEASQRLRIVADPHPDQLQIDNRVKLVAGRCRYWASRLRMLIGADGVDAHRVRFTGTYPVACGARELYRAVPGNDSYVAGLFRELWQEQGGALDGSVHTGVVPAGARRVHRQESRPLVEVIRSINKHSNNVMARQLFLTLGAERASVPGTPEGGNQAIRDWLSSRGIEPGTLYLDNGAGLSRDTRVSARQLGQVLELAWRHALMPEFLSSLPVAGVDGTLRKRHAVASLVGTAHLKTGLLEEVRAIAGYLHRPDGVRVVVVLHNHARADWRSGRQFQDAILDHFLNAPRLALTHGPAG
jgi:D-alanyl-D-alanine carboxypeptidase/D-alanyl-D-alanine-endopeptidase (penicillin-binding protein 4)